MNQELKDELELLSGWDIPKCDVLEFLLEKLEEHSYVKLEYSTNNWYVETTHGDFLNGASSESPLEAVLWLSYRLFKEGVLTK